MSSLGLSALLIGPLGPMELIAVLGVAVLLFGGKKIPEVAKGLGEGIRNFKQGMRGDDDRPELEDRNYRDDDRRYRDDVDHRREESRRSI